MFVFGHIGITVLVARQIKKDIDTRKVAAFSLLADIIDKPLGLLYPEKFGLHTRIGAHTLIACVVVAIAAYLFRKKYKDTATYSGAYLFHMILDRMWHVDNLPTFLWPFLGTPEVQPLHAFERWALLIKTPYSLFGEIIGILIILYFLFSRKIIQKNNFIAYMKTGIIK